MSNIPRTVSIKYGWAEGPWHATRFARELEAKGLTLIDDAATADIIFAHSSGCYQVPRNARAKLVILTGLPYGPVPHLSVGLIRKEIQEIKYHHGIKELRWWFEKLFHNVWYMITKPQATYYVLRKHELGNLPGSAGRRVLLVRPGDDALMYPDTDTLLAGRGYVLIEIPGSHDSCWVNPQPYVDLMT
jgi:hypothetical protein